ncbi:sigma 54-interacting transcriptional regulator [Mariniflexile gromovii]|uniref:Sigma 54-interacting transcriptional regulator n=1 Tax=Mariniflexile gromovii TaxID=362523 RepID=A0ABS4BUP0_9FLAO|nr:sigma 54-interacting transcriptional regulator [Mariniflexile gromovii]MBP0904314.1 sigma 54-interacting transcriptional regulator [Mariniflexile gromovii]
MKKKILIVEDEFIVANDLSWILRKADFEVSGIADSYEDALKQIATLKPDLAILDIRLNGQLTGIDLANKLNEFRIPFIYLSANSNRSTLEEAKATKPYGFLVKPFREKDVIISLEIASYHHEHSNGFNDTIQKNLSLKLNTLLGLESNVDNLCLELTKTFQSYIPFDYLELTSSNNNTFQSSMGCYRIGFNEYQRIGLKELSAISRINLKVLKEMYNASEMLVQPKIYSQIEFRESLKNNHYKKALAKIFNLNSQMTIPLTLGEELYNLSFFSKIPNIFTNVELEILSRLTPAIEQIFSVAVNQHAEKYKPKELPTKTHNTPIKHFSGMVGNSPNLLTVFDHIKMVAPMDTSVLILGESGTGKELVAKSIHNLSPRKNGPFIVVNCGALPENLIESILFGHEKGAFTGANEKRIGKFEQANGGTIFLDEIGEMPLGLQVKFLRVLQEREVEKIGSNIPIKLNVRVVTATNKNLEKEVEAGRFRLDLYYRLNIFPITLPPLRERKDDIPLLVNHFIQKICKDNNISHLKVDNIVLSCLKHYDWPGNIRELEHHVEKSILLADGDTIKDSYLPFNDINGKQFDIEPSSERIKTILEVERDYILYVLKRCNGKVFGKGGAAEFLDIHPSTLNSKIKKLEINKEDIFFKQF